MFVCCGVVFEEVVTLGADEESGWHCRWVGLRGVLGVSFRLSNIRKE